MPALDEAIYPQPGDPTIPSHANADLTPDPNPTQAITPPASPLQPRYNTPMPSRKDVERTFQECAQLIHASLRPLPTQSGDGQYVGTEEQDSGILADLKTLGPNDLKSAVQILEAKASGKPENDRKMFMEQVIQTVSGLPDHSAHRVNLTRLLQDKIWSSLSHPPLTYLGDEYRYRSADGSNNSYLYPKLGAANTPYARSIDLVTIQPAALPDPGLLFDSLLAREEFKPHPNNISSIFFNWASLIIHDCFQTDHIDNSISTTSSYLDLSILYGDTQEDQNEMRTFKDGRIKADCFAEGRLIAFPPACGVMLILLNRFHNYVVQQLAAINEKGRFTKPSDRGSPQSIKAAWAKYDNDLFQTGRLVTCGLYINIALYDYLPTILNMHRTNSSWQLDPRADMTSRYGKDVTPRGIGNQVSAEFNLAYRFHSCVGEADEKWTEAILRDILGKSPHGASCEELLMGLGKFEHALSKDPQKGPFANLKRGPDGKFNDDDLARIMTMGIDQVAGSFGARNVPKSMRAITMLGIMQSRSWNLCTLNEYRHFFGLKKYETFEEINSDPQIVSQLRHLYEHPDHIEIYPGIAIEDIKDPMVPGVGICPNYTISRVILSDAITLIRGDRFYTLDWNPGSMTNWGFNEIAYDMSISRGAVFYKLMLRTLPRHFKPDSIYAHYPMTTPSENAKIMKAQDFPVLWAEKLGPIMGMESEGFCMSGDSPFHQKQRQTMGQLLYQEAWRDDIRKFYEQTTLRLLHEKSCKVANFNQVDLTRDVGNLAHVHFAAKMFLLPLKTAENPRGIFTEHELWMAMCVMFTAALLDFDPAKSFPLLVVAKKVATMLGKLIEANVKSITATSFAAKFFDSFRENDNTLQNYGVNLIRRLKDTGMTTSAMTYSQILPTATAMVPHPSQAFSQMIDYYLGEGISHWPEIQRLSRDDSQESFDKLVRYAQEGARIAGTFGNLRRSKVSHVFQEDGKQIIVKPGDKIIASFIAASHDPKVFPNPDQVRLDRPLESYIHYGIGIHTCLGKDINMVALGSMLKTVGKLQNLRRAPGPQGQIKKVSPTWSCTDYQWTEC
ncbi:hypothetical protein LTR84_008092 [Exophiala bonariae]|uniref:Linoleate 8R-lipoxygenase n=1 Tax=Exophiala bonariae TaxID=1690606 RepID=A0AAV9NLX1_9EURO|nr:hypothetical protein LTR84_008092 [Exophiala bonariae]